MTYDIKFSISWQHYNIHIHVQWMISTCTVYLYKTIHVHVQLSMYRTRTTMNKNDYIYNDNTRTMKSYKYDEIVSFILFSNFLCHSNNSFIFQYMLNYMGELEVWILINIHVMNVYLTYMYYAFNILYTEIGLSCSLFKSLVNIYFIILHLFITLF